MASWKIFNHNSISVLVIGLFIFSISSWVSLARLYFYKNLSVFSRLPFYWHEVVYSTVLWCFVFFLWFYLEFLLFICNFIYLGLLPTLSLFLMNQAKVLRDSKRDTDVQNSLMDSVGEGEGGKIWENGIETCKISCMK